MKPDITIENHGSIFLFRPLRPFVREWLNDSVQFDAQWFGGALVVEPRYVNDLAQALREEGFSVNWDQTI